MNEFIPTRSPTSAFSTRANEHSAGSPPSTTIWWVLSIFQTLKLLHSLETRFFQNALQKLSKEEEIHRLLLPIVYSDSIHPLSKTDRQRSQWYPHGMAQRELQNNQRRQHRVNINENQLEAKVYHNVLRHSQLFQELQCTSSLVAIPQPPSSSNILRCFLWKDQWRTILHLDLTTVYFPCQRHHTHQIPTQVTIHVPLCRNSFILLLTTRLWVSFSTSAYLWIALPITTVTGRLHPWTLKVAAVTRQRSWSLLMLNYSSFTNFQRWYHSS